MELFDVFKKKKQAETIDQTPVKEPYLGDLEKTQLIFELIDVPSLVLTPPLFFCSFG